jgi:hypothetical protein
LSFKIPTMFFFFFKSQTGHWVSLDTLICYGVKFLESEIKTLFVFNFFIEKQKKRILKPFYLLDTVWEKN